MTTKYWTFCLVAALLALAKTIIRDVSLIFEGMVCGPMRVWCVVPVLWLPAWLCPPTHLPPKTNWSPTTSIGPTTNNRSPTTNTSPITTSRSPTNNTSSPFRYISSPSTAYPSFFKPLWVSWGAHSSMVKRIFYFSLQLLIFDHWIC